MKNYVAYLEQAGEGCDYTIGCGRRVWAFDAEDYSSAIKKIKRKIEDDFNYSEAFLKQVILYEIANSYDIDIDGIYAELNLSEEERKAKELKEQEIAMLAHLKQKYPNA